MRTRFSPAGYILALCCIISLASCSDNYGKKLTFDGTKGEVYYKGDGVTEADAKAVGAYLKEQEFFQNDTKVRSVQITKSKDRIEARFVVDEKALSQIPDVDKSFAILGAGMSKAVFKSAPLDIIYTDNAFKDKKTIAFQPELLTAATSVGDELKAMQHIDYQNNTLYYTDNITAADAQDLLEYLKEKQFFVPEGSNDLIIKKEADGTLWMRFPVKNEFATDNTYNMVDAFVQQMKKDKFSTSVIRFEVTDTDLRVHKTFNY